MVPTGKESLKKSFVVYMRQTHYMLVEKVLPQFSAPEKPLVVTPEDYPELRPILPQYSRLEYLLQIVTQNSILVQGLVKTPVLRYALDRWRTLV